MEQHLNIHKNAFYKKLYQPIQDEIDAAMYHPTLETFQKHPVVQTLTNHKHTIMKTFFLQLMVDLQKNGYLKEEDFTSSKVQRATRLCQGADC